MRKPRRCHMYHAPWSRWFRTFYCLGSYAHEVQIGPWVIQWFYERTLAWHHGRFHVWRDLYTNSPAYLRDALWGRS